MCVYGKTIKELAWNGVLDQSYFVEIKLDLLEGKLKCFIDGNMFKPFVRVMGWKGCNTVDTVEIKKFVPKIIGFPSSVL